MTKIKNYPLDLEVNGGDKWIGTDSATPAKLTKNFTPNNLAKYFNDKEVVEVLNQMRFFYDTVDPGDDRSSGSFSFPTEIGTSVPFSSITDLVFSKRTMGGDVVTNFMTDIVNSIIIIQDADNPDVYAFYALNSYEVDLSDPDFYNVTLSFESGNGSVEEDRDYLIGLVQFAGAGGVQTIIGDTFIDSTVTGVGEVTLSLSATGTPSNLTGLRGDNTWSTLGLESLDEGGRNAFGSTDDPIGWRLIGRDPDNYGNIGQDAIDFSSGYFEDQTLPFGGSITNSPQIGSVGPGSLTLGGTTENNSQGGIVFGGGNTLNGGPNIEPTYFVGGVVLGQYNQSYGLNYYNFTSGYKNLIGDRTQTSWSDAGFPYPYPVQYWSGQIGMYNQMPSGYASVQLGYGLLSGGPFCTTVGVANDDVTLSIAENLTNNRNALNPRFIVGCGTFAGNSANPSVGVRQNGFVVMSDGSASFPSLTNTQIDSAGNNSAVTKGWVQAQTDVNTTYDLASAQNGADVDVTLTGSDATVDTVKLVAGTNVTLSDSGTNEITINTSSDALTSEQVRIEVKNTSGGTLTKGTPVYITGTVGATIRAEVAAADASDPTKMPSVGVLSQDLINNADGYAVTGGFLTNITTDPIDGLTPTENDTVYVKAGGGLTLTKPIGSDLIQNIAKVGKVSGGNAGSLVVSSILRTNDVPNLTTGKIWVGTAANTAESGVVYLDEGNGRMGIGTTSPTYALDVVGNLNNIARLTSTTTASQLLFVDSGTTDAVAIGSSGDDLNIRVDNGYIDLKTNSGASALTRMRINSNGNVGIGTTSPGTKLHVVGDIRQSNAGPVFTAEATNGTSGLRLNLIGATGGSLLRLQEGGTNKLQVEYNGKFILNEYGSGTFTGTATQRLAVDSSGNVIEIPIGSGPVDGSGTANYVTKWSDADTITDSLLYDDGTQVLIGATSSVFSDDLYINNSAYAQSGWRVGTTTTYVGKLVNSSGVLSLEADGTRSIGFRNATNGDIVRVDGVNSRVGIGTTSPNSTLEVNGDVTVKNANGTNPTDAGSLYFRESGNTWGTDYYGFRINQQGVSNYLNFQSANLTSVTDILTLARDTGNVGIGTTSPSEKLDIEGSGSTNLEINNTLNGISLTLGAQATAARLTAGTGNRLGFGANNTADQVTISTSGNVGIGTTSPSTLLDIDASSDIAGGLNLGYVNSIDRSLRLFFTNNTSANAIFRDGTILKFNTSATVNSSSGTTKMVLTDSGNVGIGTTIPSNPLHVAGSARLDGDLVFTGTAFVNNNAGDIEIATVGNKNILFNPDGTGNVGIGTTSPAAKLDVNGGVRVADDAATASATNVGTLRYRTSGNNSYVDMCMQTGAATYAWVNIVQNNW